MKSYKDTRESSSAKKKGGSKEKEPEGVEPS
jgi:hypothetical protein